jgi:ribosomal protein S18 acetylase RimI-like enzyme
MSSPPKLINATPQDRDKCIDIVVASFIADPLLRWIIPEAPNYLQHANPAMDAFCGNAVDHGNSFYVEGFKGVVLWLPPGVEQDAEAMEATMTAGADPAVLEDVGQLLEEVQSYHPHDEPCWYLPTIGVDPAYQGLGLGAALLKESLRAVDADNLPAFLESSNPANISLYMRHGFEPMAQCQRGDSPIMTPMLRPAQS